MKLGKLVFSCNGSSLSVMSEDDQERAERTGYWQQSSHEFQASPPRTNVASTIDDADQPTLAVKSHATPIWINSKARLNTTWAQPYPSQLNKKYVAPRGQPNTHVQLDDALLVPVEVVHTASQMNNDATSMRTLNWAVSHAAPVVQADKHVRGVSFATLPKKECKRITADVPAVAQHTAKQSIKEHSIDSGPCGSLIQAVQEPTSAVDVPKSPISPAKHVREDKFIDNGKEELPLPPFMRPTAIVLPRQHSAPSTPAPLLNSTNGVPHSNCKYSVVSSAVRQGCGGTDSRCNDSMPPVATNRAAALRAAHGKAMRLKLADAEPIPKQKNLTKASAQYKALLIGNNKKKLEAVSGSKLAMSSLRSVAAPLSIAASTRPGPVSSPAATTKLCSEKRRSNSPANPTTTMMQPGPGSSPAATNKPSIASKVSHSIDEGSESTGQPAMKVKAATNSIAVQTDDTMPGESADTAAGEHIETPARSESKGETTTDSPGAVKQRLVARLWQGVPSDYVVKNVHL